MKSPKVGERVQYGTDGVHADDPVEGTIVHVFEDHTSAVVWDDGEKSDMENGELIVVPRSEFIDEVKGDRDVVAAMQTLADYGITDPIEIAILVNTHLIANRLTDEKEKVAVDSERVPCGCADPNCPETELRPKTPWIARRTVDAPEVEM